VTPYHFHPLDEFNLIEVRLLPPPPHLPFPLPSLGGNGTHSGHQMQIFSKKLLKAKKKKVLNFIGKISRNYHLLNESVEVHPITMLFQKKGGSFLFAKNSICYHFVPKGFVLGSLV
jgi:hypothetical protein